VSDTDDNEDHPNPGEKRPASDQLKNRSYEVGYGKPPMHTRFGPNNRANPRGRPRRQLTLAEELQRELQGLTSVTLHGREMRLKNQKLAAKKLVRTLMSGDVAAFKAITAELRHLPPQQTAPDVAEQSEDDKTVIEAYLVRRTAKPPDEEKPS